MTDQASELRRMMLKLDEGSVSGARSSSGARVLAVTSGKGGVGKTNVAVNLAARLAMMQRRIVLLDADLGLANADVVAGVTPPATLAHVLTGRRKLSEAMCEAPGGFQLVPGASGLAQMAALSEFERAQMMQLLRVLEREHDLIIVDTGAGVSPNVLSFVLAADEVLVVTTPEPPAMTDAYALIKAITRRREDAQIDLLVNMVRDQREGKRVYERLSAVSRRFLGVGLRDAGYLVADNRVGQAVRRRVPFVLLEPDMPASLNMKQLAHKLDRGASEPRGEGFFKRVANWLAG